MDSHLASVINLCGMALDAFGGLLLAYDLLGGEHGTLRLLIRVSCYTVLAALLTGLVLGVKFAICAGPAFGLALGLDLHRQARGFIELDQKHEWLMAFIRTAGCGLALANSESLALGLVFFGLAFSVLSILIATKIFKPIPYMRETRPTITLAKFAMPLKRGLLIASLGLLSVLIVGPGLTLVGFGLKFGLTFGLVLAFLVIFSPTLEWYVDSLPDKALGTAGACMFVVGFFLQALPDLLNVILTHA